MDAIEAAEAAPGVRPGTGLRIRSRLRIEGREAMSESPDKNGLSCRKITNLEVPNDKLY